MGLLLTGILIILVGGFLSLLVQDLFKAKCFAATTVFSFPFLLFPVLQVLFTAKPFQLFFSLPYPIGTVQLLLDPLAAFFILLISLTGTLCAIYAVSYMTPYLNRKYPAGVHFLSLAILLDSMTLVCLTQNAVAFLIFWELMSISSFLLIILEHSKKEVLSAGINYLINMQIGFFILLTVFVYLWLKTGALDFAAFAPLLNPMAPYGTAILIVLLAGFGMKAGFFPLHTWLPKAHPAAPSHISALMSGVMIKTGLYGFLRFVLLAGKPSLTLAYFLLLISLITAMYGIIYAISQRDMKKILAYSSVENMGIIGLGLSVGLLGLAYDHPLVSIFGFSGALLHTLNHAIFKPLLFFSAGSVYQVTHTRNIELLGGVAKKLPLISRTFLIASMAISGLPLLNGFISEFFIYYGMFLMFNLNNPFVFVLSAISIGILGFVGAMTLLCFTRLYGVVFSGEPRQLSDYHHIDNTLMQEIPLIILCTLIFLIGLFPHDAILIIMTPMNLFLTHPIMQHPALDTLHALSGGSVIFILMVLLLYGYRALTRKKTVYQRTWDCGYSAGTPRMQYSASSFSKSFLELVKPFITIKTSSTHIEAVYPKTFSLKTSVQFRFEKYIFSPALRITKTWFDRLAWVQSGYTQDYVLYGVVFLVLTLIWILFVN